MIRKKTAPSYRLICVVLAVVLLLALAVPGLAEHQWSNQIHSFERTDPVYDETVELGTARDALHLPDTLRAIVGIPEEMDVSTFLQAAPEADTSDGSESFDYYWYGYVAPKGADALVEAGEKAIYTIYYANGDLAYRLYGSIEGSENLWFACDEAGNITGAVLDIPVEWSGSYDGETAGTYTFTARVSGESSYHWSGSAPTASIYVAQDDGSDDDHSDEPICTCGAQPDENGVTLHAEDCPCYTVPEPVCTCGAQPDENGVTVHAEDCPCYTASEPVCTCGAQPREDGAIIHAEDCPCYVSKEIHCTCTVGEDVVSSDHDASCPFYQAALLCICGLATNEPSEQHAEDCPCYVLPLTDCHCGLDGEPIDADNYPWAHQEDCKYFSPIECMCRELVAVEMEGYAGHSDEYVGTYTEYVPGDFSHVHDPANRDCPLYGKDTVRIVKLDTGEESVMSVEDAERLVAYQNTHGASDRDIYTVARDPEQENAERENAVQAYAKNFAQNQESSAVMYPVLGEISIIEGSEQAGEYDPELALYGAGEPAGSVEESQLKIVKDNIPTLGNTARFPDAPEGTGPWIDYVRTRFFNDYKKQIGEWAEPTGLQFGPWDGRVANGSSGDVTTNRVKIPSKDSGAYEVYSAEQFRYAITQCGFGGSIKLMANIDLNGANYSWGGLNLHNYTLTLIGNNKTIYNLGMILTTKNSGMAYNGGVVVSDLKISSAKLVWNVSSGVTASKWSDTIIDTGLGYCGLFVNHGKGGGTVSNLIVENSTFAQTSTNKYASGALGGIGHLIGGKIQKSGVVDCIIGGLGHPGALLGFADGANVSNSYTNGCRIYALRGDHGGIFASCSSTNCSFTNCIASGELYAQGNSGGFIGNPARGGTIKNCAVTGKLEARYNSGGFIGEASTWDKEVGATTIENCYTTVLVGLRSDVEITGGFIGRLNRQQKQVTINNCYAAGEVGDFSTNLSNPEDTGGFVGLIALDGAAASRYKLTNCFYDKQTTAMREWEAGNRDEPVDGVTGLLTNPKNKGGTGMASGQNFGLGPKENGVWSYSENHYPQLQVFSGASKDNGWGTEAAASLVQTISSVSTATVFLDTWETGYDWDAHGVRTTKEVSYDREPDGTAHRADKYTYDTVREIISPFTVTSGTWKELIPGGAKTQLEVVGGTSQNATTKNIVIDGTNGTVEGPGMNWFSVSEVVGSQTVSRPLRLTGYMSIDAGDNHTVADNNPVESGATYDHRDGVTLTVMDNIRENLVVGMHDKEYWSTAKRAGYPTESNKSSLQSTGYYGVPTDHENHLKTNFSASIGAILNTEIWRVAKTADGKYAEDENGQYVINCSVKVTGEGTSGASGKDPTADEKKWNGDSSAPFFVDENQLYEVSYYWQLADGRYVTDSKWVEVVPTTRNLTVEAHGVDGKLTKDALRLNANLGENSILTAAAPSQTATKTDIPVAEPSTAVWKKANSDAEITQIDIQMSDHNNVTRGSQTISKETIAEVTPKNPLEIWVPIYYFYTSDVKQTTGDQELREESNSVDALVCYNLCVTEDGIYYIMFNRSHSAGETESPYVKLFKTGDPEKDEEAGKAFEGLNFKDMHYNVRVIVTVEENAYVQVKKVVDGYTEAMKDQTFTINLTRTNTGESIAQVNLKHDGTSNFIKVPITGSDAIKLSEVLPMEFQLESLTFTQPEGSKAVLTNDGTLTLHAGDRVTLIVHNTYTGQGYFKSRTQKNNTFWPAT